MDRVDTALVRSSSIAAFILLAAVLTFHGGVLFTTGSTFPWDFPGHHYPLAAAYADSLSEGQLPLWEPYLYSGRPLAANPQTAVFYPGMLAVAALGRDGLLARLEWLLALHIFLAGLLTFFLAKRLGASPAAALTGALIFELGGFFASQAEHLAAVCGAPWLVLALLGVLAPPAVRICCVSVAWAMSFLLGFTAFSLMTMAATALFAVWMVPRIPALRDLLVSGILMILMVFAQLGMTMELAGQSVGKYRTDWVGAGGGIVPEALISLIVPDYHHVFDLSQFHGRADLTQMYLFSGWVALVLAFLALRRQSLPLACFTTSCFVLMLGQYTPIGRSLFRSFPQILQNGTYWYVYLAPALLGLSLLASLGARRLGRWAALAAILAAAELILIGSNRPFNRERIAQSQMPASDSILGSQQTAVELRSLAGAYRIDTADSEMTFISAAPILRWRTSAGYDPLALEGYMRLRAQAVRNPQRWGANYPIGYPDSEALNWMSVRILLSGTPLNTRRLRLETKLAGRFVYRNPEALSRYRASGCSVNVVTESRNEIDIDTNCPRATLLETSEANYSDWRVSIDGRDSRVENVHGAFRGVNLPAGSHRVRFWYSTRHLAAYALVSLLGWSAWAVLAIRARRPARPA